MCFNMRRASTCDYTVRKLLYFMQIRSSLCKIGDATRIWCSRKGSILKLEFFFIIILRPLFKGKNFFIHQAVQIRIQGNFSKVLETLKGNYILLRQPSPKLPQKSIGTLLTTKENFCIFTRSYFACLGENSPYKIIHFWMISESNDQSDALTAK